VESFSLPGATRWPSDPKTNPESFVGVWEALGGAKALADGRINGLGWCPCGPVDGMRRREFIAGLGGDTQDGDVRRTRAFKGTNHSHSRLTHWTESLPGASARHRDNQG
jgi:hypothetical protein